MSTFKGFFEEIPGIAVDCFEGDCLQSKFLFLSHCHADHMVGLPTLTSLAVPLFASEISAVFLQKQFPNIAKAIETLETESPLELSYHIDEQEFHLIVTALPANHCPGSVMFLFETQAHTVLYTGDFRILKKDFHKYDIVKNKCIDSLHLDSTFLSQRYNEFPTQMESISKICSLMAEWLDKDADNKILIEMPAQYGIEFLFIVIKRKLGQRIYVNDQQWQKYAYLPAMDECISSIAKNCRIFTQFKACFGARTVVGNNFLTLKPSAMFWTNWKRGEPFVLKNHDINEYRIAYSNHSSCSELKEFLEFTQPKSVSLNVVPENQREAYLKCLESIYTPPKKPETIENQIQKVENLCFDNIFLVPSPNKVNRNSQDVKLLPKRLKL